MTKNSLCAVSLVAAVPGAMLAYFAVMSFVNFSERSPGGFKGIAGVAALLGILLAAMPLGIFLLGGPKAEKKPPKEKGADAAEGAVSVAEEVDEIEEDAVVAESDDGELEVAEESVGDFEEEEVVVVEADSEASLSDDSAWEETSESLEVSEDSFDFGDEEAEVVKEEEKPKKKKGK